MLSMMKILLKREVGGSALKSWNYFVDHGKSWNRVFEFPLELCKIPALQVGW